MDLRNRKVSLCALIGLLGPASVPLGMGSATTLETEPRAARLLARPAPLFVENRGQVPENIRFAVPGRDRTLAFAARGFTLSLAARRDTGQRGHNVRIEFVGGREVRPAGLEQQVTRMSWFRGRPDQWITGVPTYGGVRYRKVWPGIDAVYRGETGRVKGEYVVAPGADPARVRLRYTGGTSVRVDEDGSLRIETPAGELIDPAPVAYQDVAGQRRPVSCAYDLTGDIVGFRLGEYDRGEPLIIDPVTVIACGYFGTLWSNDTIQNVATDAEGNCYVGGYTNGWWIGQDLHSRDIDPALNDPNSDYYECLVAKVSADGTQYLWGAVFGGDGEDFINAISVDSQQRLCVTGYTNSVGGFPAILGPSLTPSYGTTPDSVGDAFVARLDAAGLRLQYCGYIGGAGRDTGLGIATEGGMTYVVGTTFSDQATFPVRGGPYGGTDPIYGGAGDGFIAAVLPDGSGLYYCGYLGGPAPDSALSVAAGFGVLQVVGVTASSTGFFPAFPEGLAPSGTGFVVMVDAVTGVTQRFGYMPGNCRDVALSANGSVYVTGTADEAPEGQESFVARLLFNNLGIDWFRTFGGSGTDVAHGIGVDSDGIATVVGWTTTTDGSFPTVDGPNSAHSGQLDVFVTRFTAEDGQIITSGFIGGPDQDRISNAFGHPLVNVSRIGPGTCVAVTPDGDAWIGGTTNSIEGLPLRGGPFLQTWGPQDGFLARIGPPTPLPPTDVHASPEPGPQVRVSWLPGDTVFDAFEVERAPEGGGFSPLAQVGVAFRQYVDDTVNPGCGYRYRVRALMGSRASSYSTEARTCAYPLEAPVLLEVATVAADAFSVDWEDRSRREDGFELERSTDGVNFAIIYAQGGEPGTGYRINFTNGGLQAGTTYFYRVRATLGEFLSDYSDVLSSVAGPLGAPTGLTATALSPVSVRLGWIDNSMNESGFRVERAETPGGSAPGDFETLDTVAARGGSRTAISYTDTTVEPGKSYQYRVFAYRGAENSAFSNIAAVDTEDLPAAPTELRAVRTSSREITLTFQDNAPNEDGFAIEASPTHLAAVRRLPLLSASPSTGAIVTYRAQVGRAPLVWRSATYRFRVAAFRRLTRSRVLYGPFTEWVIETPSAARRSPKP